MSPGSRPATGPSDAAAPSLATRVHLVGGALLAGAAVGGGGVGVGTVVTGVATAADTGFLLGLVAFGFGLLGWAGSIIAGSGLEAMQAQLDTASGWSEADSRRAMARIGGFGVGVMLAAMLVGTALGYT
jgi:hypothetical protein